MVECTKVLRYFTAMCNCLLLRIWMKISSEYNACTLLRLASRINHCVGSIPLQVNFVYSTQ
jgi:hypothetical protein